MDFEEVLNNVGSFGRFQKRLFAMLFFAGIPNAFPPMMFAFTQYEPHYHCSLPHSLKTLENSTTYERLLNLSIPWESDAYGVKIRSRCEMFDVDFENDTNLFSVPKSTDKKVACRYGHDFEDMNTAVAEFDMVCSQSWKSAFAITLYMIGMGLAAFSGYFSDRFGRRPLFLIFTFAQFIFTGVLSFTWNYSSYATLVLVVGLCGMVNYVVAFVFATEMMGIKRQLGIAIAICVAFAVGYVLTPLLGLLFPNWRWYLRINCLIGILYTPLLWYFPESLRWYMVSKKEKEAKALMVKIAKENGKKVDADYVYNSFQIFQKSEEEKFTSLNKRESESNDKETSYFVQLRVPTMRMRYITVCFSWFVVSLVYFAISLNPSHLSGDRLMNVFLTGVAEFPGFALAYYLPKMIGRVRSTSILYILCGVSCVIAPLLRKQSPSLVTALILVSKMTATAAFDIIYLITSEISPTLVRNTSLGVSSVCARVAGTIMPYVMLIGDAKTMIAPYVFMGGASLLSGISYLFFVPETGGILMPDSIESAMKNKRIYGLNIFKRFPAIKDNNSKAELQSLKA